MTKYIVLLNQTSLGIATNDSCIPDEFLQYPRDIQVFSSQEEAYEFINSKYDFDDLWEFGVPDGLIFGKVYHRSSKQ